MVASVAAIGAITTHVHAQSPSDPDVPLPQVKVQQSTAPAKPSKQRPAAAKASAPLAEAPPPAAAGLDQSSVASFNGDGATAQSGGFLVPNPTFGPFGEQSQLDTPFSVNSIPQAIIQDQQARTEGDVLRNDPSVYQYGQSNQFGYSNFRIRGFDASDSQSHRIDGLPISSQGSELIYGYERVDVYKGVSGLMYGFANPGGVINFVTKKPLSESLTEVSFNYISPEWFGGTLDVSRRFGDNKQFGVRANLAAHEGDIDVSGSENTDLFGALAFDWRFTPTSRLWSNVSYSNNEYQGLQPNFIIGNFDVPHAPDTSEYYGQRYSLHAGENKTAELGWEGDLSSWLSGRATVGHFTVDRDVRYMGGILQDNSGNYLLRINPHNRFEINDLSGQVFLSPHFETGIIRNKLDVGATFNEEEVEFYNVQPLGLVGIFNFSNPHAAPDPVGTFARGPTNLSTVRLNNYVIRDTLDITRYLTLMGGVAFSTVEQSSSASPVEMKQDHTTPSAAIILKPTSQISIYSSYIQGLQAGSRAGPTFNGSPVSNANALLSPFVSTQYEAGVKFDLNEAFQLNAAVFQVNNPNALYEPDDPAGSSYTFTDNGEQRNQGIEFTATGRVADGLRLFGGATFLDPTIENSQNGAFDGKDAVGVPRVRGNLFVEYDVAAFKGLTLMAGAFYTGETFANSLNTQVVPSFITGDLGFKYTTLVEGNEATLRFYAQNFTGEDYWVTVGSGALALGTPRAFKLDMSMKF